MKRLVLLLLSVSSSAVVADGIDDFRSDTQWQPVANGVWKAVLGDMSHEMRYTDLAAAPPKLDRLNQQKATPFPFDEQPFRYRLMQDHRVAVHIPTAATEKIYGYGLQFDGSSKNGKILELRVDHFNRGGGATHAPVPFFISSRGYGVFLNTAKYIKVYNNVGNRKDSPNNPPPVDRNPPADEIQPGPWLDQPPADAIEAYLHGDGLEVIVFSGETLQDVVGRYNLFCGGGAMPPLWGLGFWHRVPANFNAQQTLDEVAKFDQHNMPLDVIGLEPGWQTKSYPCTFAWQKKRFPDPQGFVQGLLARGIRVNLWENPYVSPEATIYQAMFPLSGSHLVWLGLVPDYTLEEARRLLTDQHRTEHIEIGISGYKIDEVDGYDFWLWPDHATFPSGTSGEVMRQTYGLQMQKMLYHDLFRSNNQRTYGLVRASNGGASAYPFAIYSDSYGHKQYINGLSAASLCGILWCPEIRSASNDQEWLNRMHTVCFSPLAMLNAWASGLKPWSYPEVTGAIREAIQLRMRLLPYLYSAFAEYHRTGIPPVRSMLLEATGAEDVKADESLFMFGPSILVAPFYEDRSNERAIGLPAGNWYDFYSGEFVGNGDTIRRTAAEMKGRVPLFVKEGAVIPMLAEAVANTQAAYGKPLEIRHYGRQAGDFELYEDDGKTFNFERGEYRVRKLAVPMRGPIRESITGDGPPMFGAVQTLRRMTVQSP